MSVRRVTAVFEDEDWTRVPHWLQNASSGRSAWLHDGQVWGSEDPESRGLGMRSGWFHGVRH